jgi:hypothetical protein
MDETTKIFTKEEKRKKGMDFFKEILINNQTYKEISFSGKQYQK